MQLFSDTAVNAVRVMIYLARLHEGTSVPSARIARAAGVPLPSLRRLVLPPLVTAGLVRAQKGAFGGHALARPAGEITLANIVEAIRGSIAGEQLAVGAADDPIRRQLEEVAADVAALVGHRLGLVCLDQLAGAA